jgi:hypothetical protein
VIVGLLAIVLVVAIGYAVYTSAPATPIPAVTSSSVLSSSAVGSTSLPAEVTISSNGSAPSSGLNITYMYANIDDPGGPAPYSISSSIADGNTFKGASGQEISVLFQVIYQDCSLGCPNTVTKVTTPTPGFEVMGTSPVVPVPFQQCGICTDGDSSIVTSTGEEIAIAVNIMPPSTPYSGTLTLVAETG